MQHYFEKKEMYELPGQKWKIWSVWGKYVPETLMRSLIELEGAFNEALA